jgi:subtilase family serine protease
MRVRLLAVAVLALVVVAAALTASSGSKAAIARMTPAVRLSPNTMQKISPSDTTPGGIVHFSCQLTSPPGCYGPDQIRAAYAIQPLLDRGIDGSGRTIVIVDAFGSPTLGPDVSFFDTLWGLAPANVTVTAPFGVGTTDPANAFGWQAETSLDVEWAHVVAPGAHIVLVVARTSDDQDILNATKYAVDNNLGDVISQSFGEAEQCMDPAILAQQHVLFNQASAKGITLLASSGDSGSSQFTCDGKAFFKAVSTPATDPNVTAVGGTRLVADGVSGAYQSESVWNEETTFGIIDQEPLAPGGGVSVIFSRPDYQAPVVKDTHMREVPDVAYNAAINGGVITVIDLQDIGCCFRVGGTSVGSPQWAGIVALADQMAGGRIGQLNKTLYHLGQRGSASSFFHDITVGTNAVIANPAFPGSPIAGFNAVPGWDETTGWGTPIASALVPALASPGQGG